MDRHYRERFGADAVVDFDDVFRLNELLTLEGLTPEDVDTFLAASETACVNGRGMRALLDSGELADCAIRVVRAGRASRVAKLMLRDDIAPRSNGVTIVAAIGDRGQIGLGGGIPWRLPADLKHFKRLTAGGTVLVGRRTFESMPPLKGRRVVVVSSKDEVPGADQVVAGPYDAGVPVGGLFVCGGTGVYEAFMHVADRMVLSRVPYDGPADTFFPDFKDPGLGWVMLAEPERMDGFVIEEYYKLAEA